jgi:hypothetical protein
MATGVITAVTPVTSDTREFSEHRQSDGLCLGGGDRGDQGDRVIAPRARWPAAEQLSMPAASSRQP